MNPTFIKYEPNETLENLRGPYEPLGIATIEITLKNDKKLRLKYTVKSNKEGNGYFISEFFQKFNGNGNKSCEWESNFDKEEIESLIRKNVNQSIHAKSSLSRNAPEECPF